jgi:hypothetical protein
MLKTTEWQGGAPAIEPQKKPWVNRWEMFWAD